MGPTGPAGPSAFVVGGGTGAANLANGAIRSVSMFNSNSSATEAAVNVAIPVAGVLSNLDVRLDGTVGAAPRSYTFNIRINGVDAGNPTCTISGASTSCTDALTSVAVAAGDLVSIRVVPSATNPTARPMRWSARFSATP
jgi:hypothetical protein